MRVLIVGGTGNISWRLANAALEQDWDVTILNRGMGTRRTIPRGCQALLVDIRNMKASQEALAQHTFDVVIDFLCYNRAQAEHAIALFGGRTTHYVFISTTALYDRAVASQPLTEASPIITCGWDYALAKAQAEQVFLSANASSGFPITIIRPGHTYDIIIPEAVGNSDWTNPWRLLNDKPIVLHGDGTTLWTITHSSDLAHGIVSLLRAGIAPGETFHITADQSATWREITAVICQTIGVTSPRICYRTSEEIDRVSTWLGNGIKGHKMWCDVYDNTKFKAVCPDWRCEASLQQGIADAVAFFRANDQRLVPSPKVNTIIEELVALRR